MNRILPATGTFISLLGVFIYLLYSLGGKLSLYAAAPAELAMLAMVAATGSLLLLMAYHGLIRRLAWKHYPGLRLTLSLFLLWGVSMALAWALSIILEDLIVRTGLYPPENTKVFRLTAAIICLILALLFTLIDFSWFAYYRFSAEQLALARTSRRQQELQLEVLRAQLTPHYLFNSLNTASNLVSYDSSGAETYLRKLAHNIQYLMARPNEVLSSLQQELEVVDSFFHLMQVRWGDRIKLEKHIDPACLQHKIPYMALQLLVENALKHNVASESKPVIITITANREAVVVENNLTRPPLDLSSSKVGLSNLEERYQHLTAGKPEVEQHQEYFRVRLPYINPRRKEAYV